MRSSKAKWDVTPSLDPLAATYAPSTVNFDFPDPNDAEGVERYFVGFFRNEGTDRKEGDALYEISCAIQSDGRPGDCEWVEEKQCREVYHVGRMSRISNESVFEAVEESGAGGWLENPHDYEGYLYLGDLHWAGIADWENSKEFLANLLHYGLIRTNLRDAEKTRAG